MRGNATHVRLYSICSLFKRVHNCDNIHTDNYIVAIGEFVVNARRFAVCVYLQCEIKIRATTQTKVSRQVSSHSARFLSYARVIAGSTRLIRSRDSIARSRDLL